jgi:hypothetical protein
VGPHVRVWYVRPCGSHPAGKHPDKKLSVETVLIHSLAGLQERVPARVLEGTITFEKGAGLVLSNNTFGQGQTIHQLLHR